MPGTKVRSTAKPAGHVAGRVDQVMGRQGPAHQAGHLRRRPPVRRGQVPLLQADSEAQSVHLARRACSISVTCCGRPPRSTTWSSRPRSSTACRSRSARCLFVDTADFRLYNNAFILRRRIPYHGRIPERGSRDRVQVPPLGHPAGCRDGRAAADPRAPTGSSSSVRRCRSRIGSAGSGCSSPTTCSFPRSQMRDTAESCRWRR